MDDFGSLELAGNRVILTSVQFEEVEQLFSLIDGSRKHLATWLPWVEFVQKVDDERHIVEQWLYDMQIRAAIHLCITCDGEIAGVISTHQIDWLNQRTSIGYWVAHDQVRNHYATEATAILMTYLFDKLKLHRIYIQAATGNEPSNRVIKNLRFKFEGVLRENERVKETFLDHNIYGMTSEDFRECRDNLKQYLER